MRQYFDAGNTLSYQFRKQQLIKLKDAVASHEQQLYDAFYKDLKKSPEECWVTENGMVLSEIRYAISNLQSWMKAERVSTNLLNLPSSSHIMKEPLGVVLIIAPWNYPFQLLFNPLVGAIAAGNCVVLKPSEFAPATAAVMRKIIEEIFPKEYIFYVEGDGAAVIPEMVNNFIFDHIFYTGSTAVGKIIYKLAAENLVPVTLELGGKSPCVVEADGNIKVAAKRIAFTKFSNCGQMCIAPDYVLVHESCKEELITELENAIGQFFGSNPATSYNYGKMINEKQFDRVYAYLSQGRLVHGGKTDRSGLYIEPTIIELSGTDENVMKDEIFGPVLPIISFTKQEEALKIIALHKNPLAFYVFTSSNSKEKDWLQKVAAGGGCVNNTSLHFTNHKLPFGGRGFSGTGSYHGRFSFDTFSHKKSVLKTPTWFDPAVKYPPFNGKLNLLKKVIR